MEDGCRMIVWIIYKTSGIVQQWKWRIREHLRVIREWIGNEFVTKLLRGSYDLTMLYYIEGSNGEFYGTMEEFHRVFYFSIFFPSCLGYNSGEIIASRFFRDRISKSMDGTRPCLALEFRIRVGDTWPQRFQGMHCFRGGKFVLVKFALSDARRCITSWLKIIISGESFRWDARTGDEEGTKRARFFDKIRSVFLASWID